MSSAPRYRDCQGEDGASSLIHLEEEPPGPRCPAGGLRVEAGLDADGDGILSEEEVSAVPYRVPRPTTKSAWPAKSQADSSR